MTSNQINHLNTGLMALSLAVAAVVPFELFLFAYAVLGPAHYLTQISWLHDRNYFTTGRYDFLFLLLLAAPLTLRFFFGEIALRGLVWDGLFAAVALVAAGGMVWLRRPFHKVVLACFGAICAAFACRVENVALFFSVFVPSLVHVYIFTGAFIAFGNLKSRSVSGWISLAVFIFCGAFFFIFSVPVDGYAISTYVRASMEPLVVVPREFVILFGMNPDGETLVNVMRFIAFAYTYHYLNWFTKTRIIRWHQIPRRRALGIAGLWLLSVGIFAADYRLGISALFTLSLIHVFLEFPLNHRTFVGIGGALWGLRRRGGAVALSGRVGDRPS